MMADENNNPEAQNDAQSAEQLADNPVAAEHPHAWRAAFSSVGLTGGNFDEDLYDHTVLRAVARVPPFDADGPQRSELRKAAEEVGVDIDER